MAALPQSETLTSELSPLPVKAPSDLAASDPVEARLELTRNLRAEFFARRAEAVAHFEERRDSGRLLRRLAHITDALLKKCWQAHALPSDAALVAVGGYGRGELFPHSDVDVLILLAQPASLEVEAELERLIGLFWDLGIELGHSVRTPDECLSEAERDITVQTSLVEARFIYGNRKLFKNLIERHGKALDQRTFFRAKLLELQQRHAKYQDTPFALEPNCKESPGGLRDLHVIGWIARASNLGKSWAELAQRGLLTEVEARLFLRYENLLKVLRIHLHLLVGRREDRLVFDVQTALAQRLGLQATTSRRASELLMQRYYRAAKVVTQLNSIILQNIEGVLFPVEGVVPIVLNARFQIVNESLDMAHEHVFEQTPSALLEAFSLMQQHPELKGMTARTLRAIWHGRVLIDAEFRKQPENRKLFLSLFSAPQGIIHELRRMNQLSILGRYLPAFRRIIGQMQHDLFHVYTVDQHIMMVMRNLRRFNMLEFAHEYPLCSRLIANFERHWLLYVAALFHDIAKGRGGDHSKLGMADARRFCHNHGIGEEDTDLVVFLVEHHLTMTRITQKEDMSDPDVIRGFSQMVRSERRLTALYLLTVADVRGTSPKVWNAWKGKLLEDLFFTTQRQLRSDAEGQPPSQQDTLANRQEEARRILRLYDFDTKITDEFWEQLDIAYFIRNDAQDIAWATRAFALKADGKSVRVRARLSPLGEGLQVAVYTPDQADLLARICEYFETHRFGILDARVHTTKRGYALDTFHVADHGQAHYRGLLQRVERELAEHVEKAAPLRPPARGRLSRLSQNFPITPSVDLRPDERGQFYLLRLSAADRTGLLYTLLRILTSRQINVQTAKITTLGDRVEDFFLVEGGDLSNTKAQIELETELLAALAA